mgnify:FL=1
MKRFPSLKSSKEFAFVYNKADSFANRNLVMYKCKNSLDKNRIGISVSKKVGNSVVRHRLTRLIREIFRLNSLSFTGYDIVVVIRVAAANCGYRELENSYIKLSKLHKDKI